MSKAFHFSIGTARHARLNPSDAPSSAPFPRKPYWTSGWGPIALFSSLGLLTSLIVLLIGQQGLWY